MGMILRIASSRIVGQGDIVGEVGISASIYLLIQCERTFRRKKDAEELSCGFEVV